MYLRLTQRLKGNWGLPSVAQFHCVGAYSIVQFLIMRAGALRLRPTLVDGTMSHHTLQRSDVVPYFTKAQSPPLKAFHSANIYLSMSCVKPKGPRDVPPAVFPWICSSRAIRGFQIIFNPDAGKDGRDHSLRSDVGRLICYKNNRCVKLLGGGRSFVNALSKG